MRRLLGYCIVLCTVILVSSPITVAHASTSEPLSFSRDVTPESQVQLLSFAALDMVALKFMMASEISAWSLGISTHLSAKGMATPVTERGF